MRVVSATHAHARHFVRTRLDVGLPPSTVIAPTGSSIDATLLERYDLKHRDAFGVFERLRTKISEHTFPQVGNMAVSIGMVEIDEQEGSSDVIHSADKALYFAKENGRNQTCIFEDLISQGKITQQQKIKAREIDLF